MDYQFPISLNYLTLFNPITTGGGGGVGPDHRIIDHNSKTAQSSTSKLGDFLILSIRHILAELGGGGVEWGGVAAVVLK